MKVRLLKAAATAVAAGGATLLCLGGAQAAQAATQPGTVTVPCNAAALSSAISTAVSGATLSLTSGCTYTLTAGLPAITTGLTITGNGATVERSYVRGTADFAVFTVNSAGGDLTLNNVSVQHGGGYTAYYGGAIDNEGVVMINGGTFSNNIGGEYGGAIYNDTNATLTVKHAIFSDNSSYYAGAIYNYGTMTIASSSFTGNTGTSYYGGAIYTEGASVLITGDTFTNNSTNYEGGAIDNEYDMTLTGSTFTGNQAEYGGSVYTDGYATLSGDTFTHNFGNSGGALYNYDQATVNDSSFLYNTSYYGGGIYNDSGTLQIQRDLISHNSATNQGGGIYNDATLTTGSTFTVTDNTAVGGGGGVYNAGSHRVDLFFARISGNTPDNCEPTIGRCVN